MRQGFTLIELMIVIAIIAIIAAIAIPNLLESRITANESAAAASLKSGFHSGQTQFQAGTYSDMDSDGRGEYATDHQYLAGATSTNTKGANNTTRQLTLIAPTFNVVDEKAVGAYKYRIDSDVTAYSASGTGEALDMSNGESFWAGYAAPGSPGNDGRRCFAINVGGVVYASKADWTDAQLTMTVAVFGGTKAIFATNPTSNNSTVTSNASPYQK